MPLPFEAQLAVDKYKQDKPYLANQSDEGIFNYLKSQDSSLSYIDIGEPEKPTLNTSPSYLNSFKELFDYGIDEDSYDWMKSAYNNSLTGMSEQLVTGDQRYKLEDYDPTVLEDIGSMALSFVMPLDLLAMGTGAGVGKGLSTIALQGMQKRAGKEFGKKAMTYIVPTAINQASTIAAYEGAMGGVAASLNDENVMAGIGKGVMHGSIMGGVAGLAGGGLMYKNAKLLDTFEKAGKVGKKALTRSQGAQLKATGLGGQIAAESFAVSTAQQAELALKGEDVRLKEFGVNFAVDVGLFGLLKGSGKLLGTGKRQIDLLKGSLNANNTVKQSKPFTEVYETLMKESRLAREGGDSARAELLMKDAQDVLNEGAKLDGDFDNRIAELDNLRKKIDKVEKGELEPTPENLRDIMETTNGLIGVTENLIKEAESPNGLYKSSLAEFKSTQNELMDLMEITQGFKKPKKAIKDTPLETLRKTGKLNLSSIKEIQQIDRALKVEEGLRKDAIRNKDTEAINAANSRIRGLKQRQDNIFKTFPDWANITGQTKRGEIDIQRKLQTAGESKKNLQTYIKSVEKNVNPSLSKAAKKEIFGQESMKDATIADMELYRDFLVSKKKKPSFVNVKEINQRYKVPEQISTEYFKKLGVRDGNPDNATPEALKEYQSLVRLDREASPLTDNPLGTLDDYRDRTTLETFKSAISPVYKEVQRITGNDKISQGLLNHDTAEHAVFRGRLDDGLYSVRKKLKKVKSAKYEYLFDEPRSKARAKLSEADGGFNAGEKKFYENMIKDNTPENIALKEYRGLTDYTFDQMRLELIRNGITDKQLKKYDNEVGKQYVQGYMYRRLSEKALDALELDSNPLKLMVKRNLENAAIKEANITKEGKPKAQIQKEVNRLKNDPEFELRVRTETYDALKYGYISVNSPHLIERTGLLPEVMELPDKFGKPQKIKTYESNPRLSDAWAQNMSKYLAALRYFPEMTGLGKTYKINQFKRKQLEAAEATGSQGKYVSLAIKRQLGIDKSEFIKMNKPLYKASRRVTGLSAIVGLSSPLSGVKNLAIGIPRNVGNTGVINTFRSIGKLFDAASYKKARAKGALEYGARSLELEQHALGYKALNMSNYFKYLNLMTPTEAMNRIVSSQSGQLYFSQSLAKLRGEKGMFKLGTTKQRMRRLMNELWKLSDDEVKFLETTKDFDSAIAKETYGHIIDKVGHFSHVSTQGGTSTVILPLWMNAQEAKPFTLFQRMAMSTTIDSYNNYVKPIKEFNNYMPLVRAVGAHAASGGALYWMYDHFLGKEKPVGSKESQDDLLDSVLLNVWRSEFLGIFGDVVSPYEQGIAVPMTDPIVIRNLMEASNQLHQVFGGRKTATMAIKDFTRKTVVVANQIDVADKIRRGEGKGEYYENMKRLSVMARQFKKERGIDTYSPEGMVSRRQQYYRDLKESILFKSEEDVAKTYWAAYNFIVSDLEDINPYSRPHQRSKDAKRAIKSVISHFDPINVSDNPKGATKSMRRQFYEWMTPENVKMAKSMEKEYQYLVRKYNRIIASNKYKNLYSAYPSY